MIRGMTGENTRGGKQSYSNIKKAALKGEAGFQGIERWGINHQVSLYADDLLLYMRDPLASHTS